jgi:hypothetical protein
MKYKIPIRSGRASRWLGAHWAAGRVRRELAVHWSARSPPTARTCHVHTWSECHLLLPGPEGATTALRSAPLIKTPVNASREVVQVLFTGLGVKRVNYLCFVCRSNPIGINCNYTNHRTLHYCYVSGFIIYILYNSFATMSQMCEVYYP